MESRALIGKTIKDILLWSKIEFGGLEEAEVYLALDTGAIVGIPLSLDQKRIDSVPKEGSVSLFVDLSDQPVYHVNPEGKSTGEILAAKQKRETSLLGKIKKTLGLSETIPREYIPYKTSYQENKLKYLKDQEISELIFYEEDEPKGFLCLKNGYIIGETLIAPHGIGAGLDFFENLEDLEDSHGKNYKTLI